MINIIPYKSQHHKEWDVLNKNAKNGVFIFSRDFMSYHAHRFQDYSLILKDNESIVGAFPANRQEDVIISHQGLTFGGLIYTADLRAKKILESFEKIMEHYSATGCKRIIYKTVPHIFHKYPSEEDLYALYRVGANIYAREISSVIDIGHKIKYTSSRLSAIKKSIKNKVFYSEGQYITEFYSLLTNALSKHEAKPAHSENELRFLLDIFPDKIRSFVALHEKEVVACALVFDYERVVHTQYLASSDLGREIGALDGLIVHLIENVFPDRQMFSFGKSTENRGYLLNEGLIFQKEGFGGRGIVLDTYEFNLN